MTETASPNGCRWCGVDERGHFQRWKKPVDWHWWAPPTQEQIKARMQARRAARLSAEPPKFHAATAWAADHTGESADPYCADCKTDGCRRWLRIQDRRDRSRWDAIPKHVQAGFSGWGGDVPF